MARPKTKVARLRRRVKNLQRQSAKADFEAKRKKLEAAIMAATANGDAAKAAKLRLELGAAELAAAEAGRGRR